MLSQFMPMVRRFVRSRISPRDAAALLCALLLLGSLSSDVRLPAGSVLGLSSAHAQSPASGEKRQPLDLPSGGERGEEEEDPPETIQFYGEAYEGDGFFWCLDRSGSMSVDGRLEELKVEVTTALSSLSDSAEIGLVSFSDAYTAWRALPVDATPTVVGSASAWVNALEAGGWTCLGPAE